MPLHLVPRQLQYIEAVAQHGSVQAASRALGIAASAIDRQIHSLEDSSQTQLFERHPRGMRLTVAGEAIVVMSRRWRADAERLDNELRDMRGLEQGTVRIAAMDSLVNGLLPELVDWLQNNHPRIRLSVDIMTPAAAAEALDEGTVDLVVAFNLTQSRFQHRVWSWQLPFGCAVAPGHPLGQANEVTLQDISAHPTASQSSILPIRQYFDNRHAWFFSQNEPMLITNSLQLLKQAVILGKLVLITSRLDVLPELDSGTLVFVPLRERVLNEQNVSINVDTRRSLTRAARITSEKMADIATKLLDETEQARPD